MFLGGGASAIVKFHKAFPRMPENEMLVKLVMLACVLGGSLSLFIQIAANTYGKMPKM
jgi:hypothetical protein